MCLSGEGREAERKSLPSPDKIFESEKGIVYRRGAGGEADRRSPPSPDKMFEPEKGILFRRGAGGEDERKHPPSPEITLRIFRNVFVGRRERGICKNEM